MVVVPPAAVGGYGGCGGGDGAHPRRHQRLAADVCGDDRSCDRNSAGGEDRTTADAVSARSLQAPRGCVRRLRLDDAGGLAAALKKMATEFAVAGAGPTNRLRASDAVARTLAEESLVGGRRRSVVR